MKKTMDSVKAAMDAQLSKSKIGLTDAQKEKVFHDIYVNYINAGLNGLDTIVKGRLGSIGAGIGKGGKGSKTGVDKSGNVYIQKN